MLGQVIKSRHSDLLLAVFVVAVAAMLLIPLPPILLDILLAFNLSFSILLLLIGVCIPNALALLAFPALLLLTTLFRLSLNVSSTRLILTTGYAGEVIQAFGDFLIAGDPVIGAVIFTIITVVNFIVITRGAGRISEVSARFALDALPGKQMSIDADLRTGTISAEEASKRREELRKESQLYGALDGAMKFVQGDAIASLCIIVINIVGGLYIGILRNSMSFSDAVSTYTILTVGDGLVSQIPALLISICAGIVVTRVSSGDNSTLGRDLAVQLFQSPFILGVSSVLILFLGMLPNIPFLPFFFVAAVLLYLVVISLKKRGSKREEQPLLSVDTGGGINISGVEEYSEFDVEPVDIILDAEYLFKNYQSLQQRLRGWYSEFKQDFYNNTGLSLPPIRFIPSTYLEKNNYLVKSSNSILLKGRVPENSFLVTLVKSDAEEASLQVVGVEEFPFFGSHCCWCVNDEKARKVVNVTELPHYDPFQFIILRMASFFQSNPEEVLSIVNVHAELKEIQQKYPGLVNETFNSEFVNISRMTMILQELARERFNVKNFKQILESIASYCSSFAGSMVQENDFDLHDIVSFIRVDRKRTTLASYVNVRESLRTIILSKEVEELFETIRINTSSNTLVIDGSELEDLKSGLQQVINPISAAGVAQVVILTPADLYWKIKGFISLFFSSVGVVTYDELEPTIPLEKVGIWKI